MRTIQWLARGAFWVSLLIWFAGCGTRSSESMASTTEADSTLWTNWQQLPNALAAVGDLAVTSAGSPLLDVFYTSPAGSLLHQSLPTGSDPNDPASFSIAESIGSGSAPAAAAWPPQAGQSSGTLLVVTSTGSQSARMRRRDSTGTWQPWTSFTTSTQSSALAASSWGSGNLDVFYASPSGGSGTVMHQTLQSNGTFSAPQSLGGCVAGGVSSVAWHDASLNENRIEVVAVGCSGLLRKRFIHGAWDPSWTTYTFTPGSTPALAVGSDNGLRIAYVCGGAACNRWLTNADDATSTWSDEESMGGGVAGAPAATFRGATFEAWFVNSANNVYRKQLLPSLSARDQGLATADYSDLLSKLGAIGLNYAPPPGAPNTVFVPGPGGGPGKEVTLARRPATFSLAQYQTPTKPQSSSGCDIFSAVGLTEAMYKRTYGLNLNLSERWRKLVESGDGLYYSRWNSPWRKSDLDSHFLYPEAVFPYPLPAGPGQPSIAYNNGLQLGAWPTGTTGCVAGDLSNTANCLGRTDMTYWDCNAAGTVHSILDPSCTQFWTDKVLGAQRWRFFAGDWSTWTASNYDLVGQFSFMADFPGSTFADQESDAYAFSPDLIPPAYYDNAIYGVTQKQDITSYQGDLEFLRQVIYNNHEVRVSICWDAAHSACHWIYLYGYDDTTQTFTAKNSADGGPTFSYAAIKASIQGQTEYIVSVRDPSLGPANVPRFYGRFLTETSCGPGCWTYAGDLVVRRLDAATDHVAEYYPGGEGLVSSTEPTTEMPITRIYQSMDPRPARDACLAQGNDALACAVPSAWPSYPAATPIQGWADETHGLNVTSGPMAGKDFVLAANAPTGATRAVSTDGTWRITRYTWDLYDIPIVGDWDGNGTSTVGIFRPGFTPNNPSDSNQWFLSNDNQTVAVSFSYGHAGDSPIVGDWDGDGVTTVGVFRHAFSQFNSSDSQQWILHPVNAQDNPAGASDTVFLFGHDGDFPIVGDWDGDKVTTVGVFRPANSANNPTATPQWVLHPVNVQGNPAGKPDTTFYFGQDGEFPVVGDWDGNGTTTVGMFIPGYSVLNPSDSIAWVLHNSNQANSDSGASDPAQFLYGHVGDVPVAGHWKGRGATTIGVFRRAQSQVNSSDSNLWALRSTNTSGVNDIPAINYLSAQGP